MKRLLASALIVLAGGVLSAQTKNWKKDLEAKLTELYPVTTVNRQNVVTHAGAALVVNADGLPSDDGTSFIINFGIVKDGRVTNPFSESRRGGQHILQIGEKLYVRDFSVGDDKIDIRLFSEPFDSEATQRRFHAAIRFQFDRGYLPNASIDDIQRALAPVLVSENVFVARGGTPVKPATPKPATSVVDSTAPPQNADLRVGDKAPNFLLTGIDGKTYRLSDYTGKGVILVWFSATLRYQNSMIYQISQCQKLRDAKQYLKELNAAYLMISVNSPVENMQFVDTSCSGADFPVLSDPGAKVAASYGVMRVDTSSGINPCFITQTCNQPGAVVLPRGGFAFASTTYIGADGTVLYKEDQNEVGTHLSTFGRDVAVKAKELGIKTLVELNAASTGPQTKTIELGQTIAEVERLFGKPDTIAKLGTKSIYTYKNMKVIFTAGKVTDVQ